MSKRRKTKAIKIGSVRVGGANPVRIQSMTKTDTRDVGKTLVQIRRLEKAGCEIVRVAVPNEKAVTALPEIIKNISIPLIADIHFNYRLALASIAAGVHKLRINPGNIGGKERFFEVLRAAKERAIPMRIGMEYNPERTIRPKVKSVRPGGNQQAKPSSDLWAFTSPYRSPYLSNLS